MGGAVKTVKQEAAERGLSLGSTEKGEHTFLAQVKGVPMDTVMSLLHNAYGVRIFTRPPEAGASRVEQFDIPVELKGLVLTVDLLEQQDIPAIITIRVYVSQYSVARYKEEAKHLTQNQTTRLCMQTAVNARGYAMNPQRPPIKEVKGTLRSSNAPHEVTRSWASDPHAWRSEKKT